MMMKAITLWQPWATLVAVGAKPIEYRKWDFRERVDRNGRRSRTGIKVGQRVIVAAGARPVRRKEVEDLLRQIDADQTSLVAAVARPLLRRVFAGDVELPLRCIVCSAVLGEPVQYHDQPFAFPDSDRIEHHMWGWPLHDVRQSAPIPCRGRQGFWNHATVGEAA